MTQQAIAGEGITGEVQQTRIVAKLVTSAVEIQAAQKLRYKVFYEEFAAHAPENVAAEKRDFDEYDDCADHLVVIDTSLPKTEENFYGIVGTYRLIRKDLLGNERNFYTSAEYNIDSLVNSGGKLLELGRSCILPNYRTKPVMQLLWQTIAGYLQQHSIDLMFGCACVSLSNTNPDLIREELSYLHHYHAAPANLATIALPQRMARFDLMAKEDIDAKRAFAKLPPIVKGYLRLGCYIGSGAVIDEDFNSIDVCIILPTEVIAHRYINHYSKNNQRLQPNDEASINIGTILGIPLPQGS